MTLQRTYKEQCKYVEILFSTTGFIWQNIRNMLHFCGHLSCAGPQHVPNYTDCPHTPLSSINESRKHKINWLYKQTSTWFL